MIRKLRLRFIISALLSILLVLSATIAAINISNYLKTRRETNRLLDQIVESERQSMRRQYGGGFNGDMNGFYGGGGGHYRESDPEQDAPRGQYFVTVFGEEGNVWYTKFHVVSTDTDKDADETMAINVYNGQQSQGTIGEYRYKKLYSEDTIKYQMMGMGGMSDMETTIKATYVAFVDTTDSMHAVSNFVASSVIVAAISYTVLAALIILSSHFVFKTSEESYRKQKAFVTNASHELKTPLTIINTDLEILEMDNIKNEWTDSIRDQVRRLSTMTKQLVTLSKLDENDLKNYPFADFSLTDLANESINTFLPTIEQKGFVFNQQVMDGLELLGNRYLINELFYIFMDNAIKYAKEKGEISLSVKKNNRNKIEINFANDIEDTEIDTKQLLERFYRSPLSSKKEGSGIGLSIAKEIVDLHKGKINIEIKDQKIIFDITL